MWRSLCVVFVLTVFGDIYVDGDAEPRWETIRATYGLNLRSPYVFAKLPRTEWKARSQGWRKLPGSCDSGKFLGSRYIKGHDPALILMFDVNGYVAGLQNGIPKKYVDKIKTSFSYSNSHANQIDKIGDDQIYFQTVYFVNPGIICCSGRSREEFKEQGTGTGLYLQNGTDPIRDSVHVPKFEEGTNVTKWVRGGCVRTMGMHYWYDVSEDMSCSKVYPVALLYNRGKLTNFVFANFGKYEFSNRFEHPPESIIGLFLPKPMPKCITEEYRRKNGGFSSIHIFFNTRPWNLLC